MARFPYYKRNIQALGRLLAQAALDEELRKSLQKDPASFLSELGLPAQTTDLMQFTVVDGKEARNAVALPFRLNDAKLEAADKTYLEGLSALLPQPRLN